LSNLNPSIDTFKNYNIYRKELQEEEPYTKGIPYIFITTPRLNLSNDNINSNSFLIYLNTYEKDLLSSLTLYNGGNNLTSSSPFIKILTERFLNKSGKSVSSRTIDVGEDVYGYKQTLPISMIDSIIGDTLTIEYREIKNLSITKLHKVWIEYTENIRRGFYGVNKEALDQNYLDYVSSLYYFILDMDGETILYYEKFTGLVPISNPYDALVMNELNDRAVTNLSIEYVYSYMENMNPEILIDFNKVATLDPKGLPYTTKAPEKGFIPYVSNDLLPYDYVDDYDSAPKVLVVKSQNYQKDSLHPLATFKLKFYK